MFYRLLSGKISRPNTDGVMEIHKAPYDFEPTDGELSANKWRMIKLDADLQEIHRQVRTTAVFSQPDVTFPEKSGYPDTAAKQMYITPDVTLVETGTRTQRIEDVPRNNGVVVLTEKAGTIGISTSADTPVMDIRNLKLGLALDYISQIATEADLDKALTQECNNTPKVRAGVLRAIEARKYELKAVIASQ